MHEVAKKVLNLSVLFVSKVCFLLEVVSLGEGIMARGCSLSVRSVCKVSRQISVDWFANSLELFSIH